MANEHDMFVRLDMEDHRVTDDTIQVMLDMHDKGLTNVGVVLQGRLFRTLDDIDSWVKSGVDKVIIGTAAVENKNFLKEACEKFKNKIAISLDVKDGLIFLSGWKKQTNILAVNFLKEIQNFGVSRIIYTDINKDGTKEGPNIKDTIELSNKVKIPFIISGGISSIEDIKKIKSLNNSNIEGVIVGKSIYDGDIKINELAKQI